jgi:hypothetical protein
MKVGDVNGSYFGLIEDIEDRSDRSLVLRIDDKWIEQGETVYVPVYSERFNDIIGYQYTLEHSNDYLDLVDIEVSETDMLDLTNFSSITNTKHGLATSWNTTKGITMGPGELLFTIVYKARQTGKLSQMLDISNSIVHAEAYLGETSHSVVPVRLLFKEDGSAHEGFVLYQNRPNPFRGTTTIGYHLPGRAGVTLKIYTIDGQLIDQQFIQDQVPGYHEFYVDINVLRAGGVYYYTLSTGEFRATRKMILLE